jgi:hypothetical protein
MWKKMMCGKLSLLIMNEIKCMGNGFLPRFYNFKKIEVIELCLASALASLQLASSLRHNIFESGKINWCGYTRVDILYRLVPRLVKKKFSKFFCSLSG